MYFNLSTELRREGLTQQDVADLVRKTSATVNSWINGRSPLPLDAAFAIRDTYFPGMTMEYLFAFDEKGSD